MRRRLFQSVRNFLLKVISSNKDQFHLVYPINNKANTCWEPISPWQYLWVLRSSEILLNCSFIMFKDELIRIISSRWKLMDLKHFFLDIMALNIKQDTSIHYTISPGNFRLPARFIFLLSEQASKSSSNLNCINCFIC